MFCVPELRCVKSQLHNDKNNKKRCFALASDVTRFNWFHTIKCQQAQKKQKTKLKFPPVAFVREAQMKEK